MSEDSSITRDVDKIVLHNDWNVTNLKYDADIAILLFNESVLFSTVIQPVCLPSKNIEKFSFGSVVIF